MSSIRVVLLMLATFACGGSTSSTPTTLTPPIAPSSDRVLVNVDAQGVGLGGHDPVAYATDGKPVLGVAEHSSRHAGATYRFASAEHKTTFDADMAGHAPQYGGYCAFAASQNRLMPGDPQVWMIADGQLLVFTNAEFRDQFNKDPKGNKAKADQNWPGLVAAHGTPAAP